MTYLQFHFVFILPVIALLALTLPKPVGRVGARAAFVPLGLMLVAALVWTTPWDNYLVWRGVWGYPDERVIGRIGYVPIEEYLFFLLQPILVGLWVFHVRSRWTKEDPSPPPSWFKAAGVSFFLFLTVLGVACLLGPDQALYMGLILAWAPPVLAGLWWLGSDLIWLRRTEYLVGFSVPTVYLWIADRTAIDLKIWDISNQYSFDIDPFGLPIEEATFFWVTTLLVVQGLVMLLPTAPATPSATTPLQASDA